MSEMLNNKMIVRKINIHHNYQRYEVGNIKFDPIFARIRIFHSLASSLTYAYRAGALLSSFLFFKTFLFIFTRTREVRETGCLSISR